MFGERLGRFEIEGEHLLGLEIRDRVVRQRDEFPRGRFDIASVWIGGVHCHLGLDWMEFVWFDWISEVIFSLSIENLF